MGSQNRVCSRSYSARDHGNIDNSATRDVQACVYHMRAIPRISIIACAKWVMTHINIPKGFNIKEGEK